MGQCLPKFDNDTTSAARPGERLSSWVYSFQSPEVDPEVEIVFIHGLQLSGDSKDAYWKTWMASDGSGDCWPKTWLGTKFPSARVLSLSYDSNALQSPTTGRMDLYSLGESLVRQMVFQDVEIGQSGCPVVFVCHSFGGIVAKQLVVVARDRLVSEDGDIDRFLKNVKGFFFYATPHKGSEMASLFGHIPLIAASPLMEYLKIMSTANTRLCSDFKRCQGDSDWKFQVVAESHATYYNSMGLFDGVVVDEASSRHERYDFIKVQADHFNVCKPGSKVDTSYQCLTDFVSTVVEEHRRKLFACLELPSKVVGMADKSHEVKEKMKTNAIVGLVGMGGIGKTTLSKALYNEERQFFDKACFLENVASGDTEKLWERVKSDLGCDERNFEECILKKKVLLVVDDILGSSENMLKLKVAAFKKATNGSKVIVTCRNRDVLMPDYVEPGGLIDVQTLNEEQAMELFSHYAFDQTGAEEKEKFDIVAWEIVEACNGLPLSLEVIGQFLRKQRFFYPSLEDRMEVWIESKARLQEAEVLGGSAVSDDARLWKKLRISYDALMPREQRMFLDIACIICEIPQFRWPQLRDKSTMIRILGDRIALQNLVNCSLVKFVSGFSMLSVESRECVVMHDQLRDMGRRIVKDLGDEQYLWKAEDILHMFEEKKSSKTLEGLVYRKRIGQEKEECGPSSVQGLSRDRFEKLRLLCLESAELPVVEYYLSLSSHELTWLCLDSTSIESINIHMLGLFKKLRVLEMLWCNELEELPTSIGDLSDLMELNLRETSLKCLPPTIGKLEKLEVLSLRHCKELEILPSSLGQLKNLRVLDLSCCELLKEVPPGVGQLPKLRYLSLRECYQLKKLCKFDSVMRHLEELDLDSCNCLENIEGLGNLLGLTRVFLYHLVKAIVETLLVDCLCFDYLVVLYLPVFPEMELPHHAWPRLETLRLDNELHLSELPKVLGNLTSLECLTLDDGETHPCVKEIPESYLCKLKGLKELRLSNFQELEEVPGFVGELLSLASLDLSGCSKLVTLPQSLGYLFHLEYLTLRNCRMLERLPEGVGQLPALISLYLEGCFKLLWLEEGQFDILQQLHDDDCFVFLPNGISFQELDQSWEELVQDFVSWDDHRNRILHQREYWRIVPEVLEARDLKREEEGEEDDEDEVDFELKIAFEDSDLEEDCDDNEDGNEKEMDQDLQDT